MNIFQSQLEEFSLAPPALTLLEQYLGMLRTVALRVGLVGLTERQAEEQVVRCLLLTRVIGKPQLTIDVGSGAGLPGIPLAIALANNYARGNSGGGIAAVQTDSRIILLEPKRKAVAFLEKVVRDLRLSHVQIASFSAEEAASGTLRQSADVVVAKALAPPPRAAALCAPLCRPGGQVILTSNPQADRFDSWVRDLSPPTKHILSINSGIGQAVLISNKYLPET